MIAVLCDKDGKTQLGSDGYVHIDGRLGHYRRIHKATDYRNGFRRNFPHKAEKWTHVMFVHSIKHLPDPYNGMQMPERWELP